MAAPACNIRDLQQNGPIGPHELDRYPRTVTAHMAGQGGRSSEELLPELA